MPDSKTVIVTGASSGIGFGIAEGFLERGYNVVGNARTADRLLTAHQKLAMHPRFLGVAGDIGLPETSLALFEQAERHFGGVDVLVNNAGIFIVKPFEQFSTEDAQQLINTNLFGFMYPTQAAIKHMQKRKRGHIVNITASIALQPIASVPATLPILIKAGIGAATRALAIELAPHNIQVNAIAPGLVDTPLHDPSTHEFLKDLQPAGRIANVQEIVEAVIFAGEASFTTGAVIPVDGGMSAGKERR